LPEPPSRGAQPTPDTLTLPPPPPVRAQTQELTATSERDGIPPADVASLVGTALTASNPRQRYIVGTSAPVLHVMRRFLPDSVFHKAGPGGGVVSWRGRLEGWEGLNVRRGRGAPSRRPGLPARWQAWVTPFPRLTPLPPPFQIISNYYFSN
jgi:hypothetical protein